LMMTDENGVNPISEVVGRTTCDYIQNNLDR